MDLTLIIAVALIFLVTAMVWAVCAAKSSRTGLARKHKAGFLILSSLMFGIGSMTEEPPPQAEDARNNTLEKKSESAGPENAPD